MTEDLFYACEVYFKFRERDAERKRACACCNQLMYRTRFCVVFVNNSKCFLSLSFHTIKWWGQAMLKTFLSNPIAY